MPKRRDENETAFDKLQEILKRDAERDGIARKEPPQPEKIPYRVKAGRKGGKARAQTLDPKPVTSYHLGALCAPLTVLRTCFAR